MLETKEESPDEIELERPDVVVLFSGGRDSSLAVCKLAIQRKKLVLLNLLNGTTIGGEIVQNRFRELKERFPNEIQKFVQIPSFGLFRKLSIVSLEADFLRYEKNMVCLGCKLAFQTEAIIYCINNGIEVIADGYSRYQSEEYMEQRREAVEIMKNFNAEYGILYINPVYDYQNKENVKYDLYEFGLSTKSIEGTCIFSDTFSVPDAKNVISYIYDRLNICRSYIKSRIKKEGDMSQAAKIHKIGAVIVKEKRILVVRKKVSGRTEYIIPGGRPEEGETHEDTLRRELREELDVNLISYSLFGSFSEIAIFENIPIYMDVYYVDVEGSPVPRSEIKDLVWIERDYAEKGIKLGTVLSRHVIPKLIIDGLM